MADPYSDIPELSAEQAAILRRRRIAEQIQAQSMQPIPQQQAQGGYVVPTSPLLGIGKVLEAYFGKKAADRADTDQAALGKKYSDMENQAVTDYLNSRKPSNQGNIGGVTPIQPPAEMEIRELNSGSGQLPDIMTSGLPPVSGGSDGRSTQEARDLANITAQTSNFPKLRVTGALTARLDEQEQGRQERIAASAAAAKLAAENRNASKKYGTADMSIGGGMWQTYETNTDGRVNPDKPLGKPFAKRATASDISVSASSSVPKGDTKYAETRMADAADEMGKLTKAAETAHKSNKSLDRFLESS